MGSPAPVAVIGLAVRFPGAGDPRQFWTNLARGRESVRAMDPDELRRAGVTDRTLADPSYVRAAAAIADPDKFDAGFFGMTPREAADCDPQIRLFLECAHTAIYDAGYAPDAIPDAVGVFATAGPSNYLPVAGPAGADMAAGIARQTLARSDYIAMTAAYKLNLRGPSLTVSTACSSSLVALHLACSALRNGDCDLAVVGGGTLEFPVGHGYRWAEGAVLSPDGHCRPFDAAAAGTVFADGAAAVVLKLADAAEADHDRTRALVLSSAVNNDGADKVSFGAPSVDGQAQAIMEAIALAGIEPADLSYVEAHATGTKLGDPVEVAALRQAMTRLASAPLPAAGCGLGSVKGNVGHLGPLAGLASLIKTVLALEHEQLPPSINIDEPNPAIDLQRPPLRLVRQLEPWPRSPSRPRRAGVSSLGIGGTNVHLILQEAPRRPRCTHPGPQLLVWSGRSVEDRDAQGRTLAPWFVMAGDGELADAAATLVHGRTHFPHRAVAVATGAADAYRALGDPGRVWTHPDQLASALTVPDLDLRAAADPAADLEAARALARRVPLVAAELDRWFARPGGAAARSVWDGTAPAGGPGADPMAVTLLGLGISVAVARCWVAAGADPGQLRGRGLGRAALDLIGGDRDAAEAAREIAAVPPNPDTRAATLELHLRAVAHLYLDAVAIDWDAAGVPLPQTRAALPGYPFRRERHWRSVAAERTGPAERTGHERSPHLLAATWLDVTPAIDPEATTAWRRAALFAPPDRAAVLPLTLGLHRAGIRTTAVAGDRSGSSGAALADALTDALAGARPDVVVHAIGLAASHPDWSEIVEQAERLRHHLDTLDPPVPLLVCTTGGADISGAEPAEPAKVALSALGTAAVDLDASAGPETVAAALALVPSAARAGVRGRTVWRQATSAFPPAPHTRRRAGWARRGAGYLLIDPTGVLALEFGRALADHGARAHLDVVTAGTDFDKLAGTSITVAVTAWDGHPDGLHTAVASTASPGTAGVLVLADETFSCSAGEAVRWCTALAETPIPSADVAMFVRRTPEGGAPDPLAAVWGQCAAALAPEAERMIGLRVPAGTDAGDLLADLLGTHVQGDVTYQP